MRAIDPMLRHCAASFHHQDMPNHTCGPPCLRLQNLLSQGSKNGVWADLIAGYDEALARAAQSCSKVDVQEIGNKKLLVLIDEPLSPLRNSGIASRPLALPVGQSVRTITSPLSLPTTQATCISTVTRPGTPPVKDKSGPAPSCLLTPEPVREYHNVQPLMQSMPSDDLLREVQISWVEDANEFWVHLPQTSHSLKRGYLSQIEQTLLRLKGDQKPLATEELRADALTITKVGNAWTRAQVKRVDADGIFLSFIDYGDAAKRPANQVFEMPRFLRDYPAQAIPCRLQHPEGKGRLWTPTQSKYFEAILRQFPLFHCTEALIGASASTSRVSVRLFFKLASGLVKCVADTILVMEANPLRVPSATPSTPPPTPATPLYPIKLSNLATSLSPESPPEINNNSLPADAISSVVSQTSSLSLRPLPTSAVAREALATPAPMSIAPFVGQWQTFLVPAEWAPDGGLWPDHFIVCPDPVRSQYEAMMAELAVEMKRPQEKLLGKEDLVEGGCYAAFVPDVGRWARSVARRPKGSGSWLVFCADFGSLVILPVKNIRPLPVQFKTLPFQAILANLPVEPTEESSLYPIEAQKFLAEQIKTGVLHGKIARVEERQNAWPRVKITFESLMNVVKEKCVVKSLIKTGMAKAKEVA